MSRSGDIFSTPRIFRALMIGAGGNGSELFDGLTKIHNALLALGHPGLHVTVMDDDIVAEHNIVRQRFWPHEVGVHKSIALVHRANMLLGTDWTALPYRFTQEHIASLGKFELIITAVDTLTPRKLIAGACNSATQQRIRNCLWLDMGVEKKQAQVVLGALSDGHLNDPLPNITAHYPAILTQEERHSAPSCSAAESLSRQDLFINEAVAGAASQLLWQCFRRGDVPWNGVVIDLDTGFQQAIPFISHARV